jgi:Fibrobacter succinogenes major domain (Fib_succ_major).
MRMRSQKTTLALITASLPLLTLCGCSEEKSANDLLKDMRDGKTYRTVQIGNQVWMASNLNYKARKSFCYEKQNENCLRYGRLYTWASAVGKSEHQCGKGASCSLPSGNIQGICPNGWHLPSLEEWQILFKAVGGQSKAAKALKTTRDWYEGCDGTDAYGFSAKPTGFFGDYNGKFFFDFNDGSHAYFWTSAEQNDINAHAIDLSYGDEAVSIDVYKNHGFSIRCIKDNTDKESGKSTPTQKKDFDFSKYKTVQVGNRIWMAENLNEPTEESYCYDDDPQNCEKYGRLYTFKAAQKACPTGWHLANTRDEREMLHVLGESNREKQGIMLASKDWVSEQDYGDRRVQGMDVLGLAILPSGRKIQGKYAKEDRSPFLDLGSSAYIWLDSYYGGCCSDMIEIDNNDYTTTGIDTSTALAVRCVKDYEEAPAHKETPHLNGKFIEPNLSTKGTFLDSRDNYTYKTVTIGEQTWFAENLRYNMADTRCNNDDEDCSKFGRLYDWYSAMDACPQGWRLPSSKEVSDLKTAVGKSASKVKSVHGWAKNGGTDDYGLSILPIEGKVTYFWTSTKKDDLESAVYFAVSFGHDRIINSPWSTRQKASVRCIKD